jgi:alpha-glucosidase
VWNWLRAESYSVKSFLGVPGNLPRRGGEQVAATMRSFAAGMSWRSLTSSWTLLGSHDTPRVRTVVGPNGVAPALGLLMTYPGTPMVFAGDELGLLGDNGEDARRPMPWNSTWDQGNLSLYRELIQLRTSSHALRHGGLRWVHTGEDTLAYLRESDQERLLVCVRRCAGGPVSLPDLGARSVDSLFGAGSYGGGASVNGDGTIVVAEGGPSCQIFALS